MVVGPCFAMRPRKIRERYLFFRDEWPFQDERILINHHMSRFVMPTIVKDEFSVPNMVQVNLQTMTRVRHCYLSLHRMYPHWKCAARERECNASYVFEGCKPLTKCAGLENIDPCQCALSVRRVRFAAGRHTSMNLAAPDARVGTWWRCGAAVQKGMWTWMVLDFWDLRLT